MNIEAIKKEYTTIRVQKDLVKRISLVAALRRNGEPREALIGNLIDRELERLGYVENRTNGQN